jgi:hypothetical protein
LTFFKLKKKKKRKEIDQPYSTGIAAALHVVVGEGAEVGGEVGGKAPYVSTRICGFGSWN